MATEYSDFLGTTLKPKGAAAPLVVDLFAGCGGLALGFEAQGFDTCGYEMDAACCATYRRNLKGKCHTVTLTPDSALPSAPVLIGGPPCQPFSVIGNQNGLSDSRNGFPVFIEAVRRLDPEVFIFENVRGLLYRSKPYFDSVLQKLKALGYVIEYQLVNAADYGVPQRRERLIVVGHRSSFSFPKPCSRRVTAGEALGAMATTAPPESRFLTKSMDEYIARYEAASSCITPRDLHLDETARTLTCRNLAGATSDMHRIRLPDGRRRRILPREAARLQSFPDWFQFEGTETEVFNQIGNAVPPLLAYHLAGAVRACLDTKERLSPSEILYRNLPAQLELSLVHEPVEVTMTQFVQLAGKKRQTQKVVNEALHILSALGIPFHGLSPRRLEKMAMAFLAVCDVHKSGTWESAKDSTSGRALTSRQIIQYVNLHFEEQISSGSYDDIRRKDLKLPAVAGIILRSANDPEAATNNPTRAYAVNIEAVHSSGPISKLRHEQLRTLTKECSAEVVYVTAFLDRETFRKYAPDIAWETEVWIAEAPDHIVHFNGKRFLGPYKPE